MIKKSIFRTIKDSLGRYIAILAIIALGVGFFAGLRVAEESMIKTADKYLDEMNLYDFKLISTLGFTDADVEEFQKLDGIEKSIGSVSADLIYIGEDGSDRVYHAHSILDGVNGLDVIYGRLPENEHECLLDARYYAKENIGDKVVLSDSNTEETLGAFSSNEYTVVGICNSSEYINFQRGTTSLAGGSVSGFMYVLPEAFTADYYSEIYLTITDSGDIYSEEYKDRIESMKKSIDTTLERCIGVRAKQLYGEAASQYTPAFFVFDRSSNIGYASFENDTAIVSGVSKVFPVFFFLVAALVCITTMTRMVSEQRTHNGILKAMGYSDTVVISQYMVYAGSASAIGSIIGFLVGSKVMPMVLWKVYHIMYNIDRPIEFVLDWKLFFGCFALYLLCSLGATWIVCHKDLKESAAQLVRSKAPAAGKRIFLEYIGFIWKRLKFLHKVSIRNIFRYKKRMFMMIIGIGGCTALLLAGFGIRDTIKPIVKRQYEEISLYDASVKFISNQDNSNKNYFLEQCSDFADDIVLVHSSNVEISKNNETASLVMVAYNDDMSAFINLHKKNKQIEWPDKGEAFINYRLAEEMGIEAGDVIEVKDSEYNSMSLIVSDIFDNYMGDYIYVNCETCKEGWGYEPGINTAYVNFKNGVDEHKAGADIMNIDGVASVSITNDLKENVESMLESMNYIVLIVLVCAGALAFIVLYNLTNITIMERIREIATLKVLGFYNREQNSYVFRENIILTIISSICGIPLGIVLLMYVMNQIKISTFYFGYRLAPSSFVLAILITLLFTVIVDSVLTVKTKKINMAEALKEIE